MKLTPRQRSSNLQEVDITGMVDVVFLLIIFFMTTAQFARMTRAEIDLPKEQGEQREQQLSEGVVINVAQDGAIIVDGVTISMNQLVSRLAAETSKAKGDASDLKITIRADQHLSAGTLNDIARALARSGLRGVRLATEPNPGGGA
jgi:biopolymer transport protein ExbD